MSRMRKFLTATFLVCCAVGSTTVSASPVLKTTAPAAQASYQQKAAMLPGTAGTFTEQEASAAVLSRPAVITRPVYKRANTASASVHSMNSNSKMESKVAPLSPMHPISPITPSVKLPSIIPSMPSGTAPDTTEDAYAIRNDFGKSNLIKWSSAYGMNTPWSDNDVTDTADFKPSTIAFLDTLNTFARDAGISFVLTGGAEYGYHAHGTYSHENGYKVDISDTGAYPGTEAYRVLLMALAPFKHRLSHEWNNGHYDITIYPANYTGSYEGADHGSDDD
ncbi:hypothetical protein [Mitsuokella sp.]|uniref:hypothetical protein n=1 Tax=Mitsuokella sp. TaxID=2049034 RepID=UPI003D7DBA11